MYSLFAAFQYKKTTKNDKLSWRPKSVVDVNESGNMFEFIINLYSMYRCIGKNTQLHKGPPSTDRNKHNHYRD